MTKQKPIVFTFHFIASLLYNKGADCRIFSVFHDGCSYCIALDSWNCKKFNLYSTNVANKLQEFINHNSQLKQAKSQDLAASANHELTSPSRHSAFLIFFHVHKEDHSNKEMKTIKFISAAHNAPITCVPLLYEHKAALVQSWIFFSFLHLFKHTLCNNSG